MDNAVDIVLFDLVHLLFLFLFLFLFLPMHFPCLHVLCLHIVCIQWSCYGSDCITSVKTAKHKRYYFFNDGSKISFSSTVTIKKYFVYGLCFNICFNICPSAKWLITALPYLFLFCVLCSTHSCSFSCSFNLQTKLLFFLWSVAVEYCFSLNIVGFFCVSFFQFFHALVFMFLFCALFVNHACSFYMRTKLLFSLWTYEYCLSLDIVFSLSILFLHHVHAFLRMFLLCESYFTHCGLFCFWSEFITECFIRELVDVVCLYVCVVFCAHTMCFFESKACSCITKKYSMRCLKLTFCLVEHASTTSFLFLFFFCFQSNSAVSHNLQPPAFRFSVNRQIEPSLLPMSLIYDHCLNLNIVCSCSLLFLYVHYVFIVIVVLGFFYSNNSYSLRLSTKFTTKCLIHKFLYLYLSGHPCDLKSLFTNIQYFDKGIHGGPLFLHFYIILRVQNYKYRYEKLKWLMI